MKLSNIFENPAAATAARAAVGANALKKTLGTQASGAVISKALDKLDQGGVLSPQLAKAIAPYADALEKILSNPQFRNKFVQLMKQIQAADKKQEPAQSNAAQPVKLTPGWGDGGSSMKANAGKLGGQQESVSEDWGSSDGSILVQSIDDAIAKHGLSPDVIQSAAQDLAEFYYDDMGYDSPEEAVDAVIDTWKRRSATGKALAQMFAPVESVQEAEGEDTVDTVTMDVPLLLRMMEYAREDAQEDMDLHDVAERMIAMSKDGPLSMDDYDSIVGSVEALPAPEEEPVEEGYYAPGPETMPGAVGPQEDTNVSFNQTKNFGDAYVTVNANAKDMEELHRILKLAGIDYDSNGKKQEPSMQDVAVALAPHAPEAPAEEPCGCEDEEPADVKYTPSDVKYSTDKQTLINVIRDKLQKRLS